jgi:RNase P subunit RPR2
MRNDSEIIIRLPKEIKKQFSKQCSEELIGMSVKIRQIIIKELKKSNK